MGEHRTAVAVKRLAAVEIDPGRSNQHELNAGTLRLRLGLPSARTVGDITVQVHTTEAAPAVSESRYTLYNAREAVPGRSEYRLYYEGDAFRGAETGDLLVLFRDRESTDLRAIVAPAGSKSEAELLRMLEVSPGADLEGFHFVEPRRATERDADGADDAIGAKASLRSQSYAPWDHRLFAEAVESGVFPSTREMATAGQELASARDVTDDPDAHLVAWLDAETELFYAIRQWLLKGELEKMVSTGISVSDVLEWSQRHHQAARSRMGDSLQHHFAKLLDLSDISYTAQCRTEGARKPDFVLPGCREYHDVAYPAAQLRMVACKSTIRERWPQVLLEAERIDDKFLLTLDRRLSPQVIRDMTGARLYPYLPRRTIADDYARNPELDRLGTVAQLVGRLQRAD